MESRITLGYLHHVLAEAITKNPSAAQIPVVIKVYDPEDELVTEAVAESAWIIHDTLPGEDESQRVFEITAKAPAEEDTMEARLQMLRDRGHGELVDKLLAGEDDAVS